MSPSSSQTIYILFHLWTPEFLDNLYFVFKLLMLLSALEGHCRKVFEHRGLKATDPSCCLVACRLLVFILLLIGKKTWTLSRIKPMSHNLSAEDSDSSTTNFSVTRSSTTHSLIYVVTVVHIPHVFPMNKVILIFVKWFIFKYSNYPDS